MNKSLKFLLGHKRKFFIILLIGVSLTFSIRYFFPKKPKPEKCDKTKSLSTHFYGGDINCVNLKTLLIKEIKIENLRVDEKPYGFSSDQQLKITGVQKFNKDWVLTLNNGLVALMNADHLSLDSVRDIRTNLMQFSTYGGVVASYFTSKEVGYFYYSAENSLGKKILVLEKIKFNGNGSIEKRVPMLLSDVFYDHADLGGGIFADGSFLYLGVGKGVATELVGAVADRVQEKSSPFGKYLKIPFDQFNNAANLFEPIKYSIFTTGHKNPQGAKVIFGKPFSIEHGPWGGDEVNFLQQGKNYGWNKLSFGYDNERSKLINGFDTGFINPIFYFTPSIGASDLAACPFTSGESSAFYSPCIVISSLREQSLFYLKFAKSVPGEKISVFNLAPISVEKVNFGERIRRIFTEPNTVSIFTDSMNIYTQYFVPRFEGN